MDHDYRETLYYSVPVEEAEADSTALMRALYRVLRRFRRSIDSLGIPGLKLQATFRNGTALVAFTRIPVDCIGSVKACLERDFRGAEEVDQSAFEGWNDHWWEQDLDEDFS